MGTSLSLYVRWMLSIIWVAGGVGGVDGGAAVEEAFGLIEVDRLGDVGGDDGVVLLALGDAVDGDEEEDGDVVVLELAGDGDGFGCSPEWP